MANKFLIKRGSAAPNNAAIDNYELVYNYTNNELWTKHNGSVVKVSSGANGTVTNVVAGNGLSGGGTVTATLDLDFSELTDMTGDISGTTEFILQNGTTESRKAASEIKLSYFNNDSNWTSNAGTVTSIATGTGLTGGTITGSGTISLTNHSGDLITSGTVAAARIANLPASKITSGAFDIDRLPTAAVTNGDINNVPTADNVYDFVTGQGYLTSVPNHSASLITSGTLNNARLNTDMQLTSAAPRYRLQESDVTNTPNWWMVADGGNMSFRLNNTGTYPLVFQTNGTNDAVTGINLGYATAINGTLEVNNRITATGTGGFTIGNYAGYDRIQNSSNVFSFLTDGNAQANMQFGTVTVGTWNGSVIASAYLDSDTAHLSGTQTFSGTKTFSSAVKLESELDFTGNGNKIIDVETLEGNNYLLIRHHNPLGNQFENALKLTANGSAELYYNNSKKFETTNTGATVTGALDVTGALSFGSISGAISTTGNINTSGVYQMDGTTIIDSSKVPINIPNPHGTDRTGSVLVTDYAGVQSPTTSGWYTIAKGTLHDARGGGIIGISFTGGYASPKTFTCDFQVGWSGELHRCNISNETDVITKVRLITTSSTTELQAYFNISSGLSDNPQNMNVRFTRDKYNPYWSIEDPLTQVASPLETREEVTSASPTGRGVKFYSSDTNLFEINNSHVVINELSKNVDFRVEGNGDANLLFTDGGNDRVGIGTASPDAKLEVTGSTNTDLFSLEGAGSSFKLIAESGSTGSADIMAYRLGLRYGSNDNGFIDFYRGPDGATGYLAFGASGSEAMRLDRFGNFGIGVSNPDSPLHIGNNVATSAGFDSFADYQILLYDTGTSTTSYGMGIRANTFMFNSDVDFEWRSDNSAKMFLDGANGRLGIGTVSPGEKLEVNGSIALSNNTYFKARNSVGALVPLFRLNSSNHIEIINGNSTNGDIIFKDASDTNMTIKGDTGNVGISTTSPNHLLEIEGQTNDTEVVQISNNAGGSGSVTGITHLGITHFPGNTYSSTRITAIENGTASYTGHLAFSTRSANTDSAPAERMRIASSGNVGIGMSSNINERLNVYHSSSADVLGIVGVGSAASTNFANINFRNLYSSATGDSAIIGCDTGSTTDKGELVFSTSGGSMNASEKMRITSGGNVGIGITNPASLLTVNGTARFNTATGSDPFWITRQGNTNESLRIYVDDSSAVFQTFQDETTGDRGNFVFVMDSDSTAYTDFRHGTATKMRIKSDGNVGIGIVSPQQKLHIFQTEGGVGAKHATIRLGGYLTVGAEIAAYRHTGNSNDQGLIFSTYHNTNGTTDTMTLDSLGNVGIGTTSPAYKLDVRGSDIYTDGYIRADDGVITWSSTDGSVVTLTNNGTYTMLNNPQGNVGIYIGDTGDGQNYYQSGAHRFRSYDGSTYQGTFNNTGLKLGTGYASYKLDVAGDAKISSGSLGVGVNPNATDGRGDFSNDVVAYSTSDKRLKENIKPLDSALDKVMNISGVSFDWKALTEEEKKTIHGNEGHDVGVIAQEIEKVLPEVVTTRDSGYKAVKYEKIVPLLIEAIKEQQQQINQLKEKLNG